LPVVHTLAEIPGIGNTGVDKMICMGANCVLLFLPLWEEAAFSYTLQTFAVNEVALFIYIWFIYINDCYEYT
jgi:hypothetical protein